MYTMHKFNILNLKSEIWNTIWPPFHTDIRLVDSITSFMFLSHKLPSLKTLICFCKTSKVDKNPSVQSYNTTGDAGDTKNKRSLSGNVREKLALKLYNSCSRSPLYSWINVSRKHQDYKKDKMHYKCLTCQRLISPWNKFSLIKSYFNGKHQQL